MRENIVSFDDAKAGRYLERALFSFLGDAPDSDYQRGFLGALLTVYKEGMGKGANDARVAALEEMVRADA